MILASITVAEADGRRDHQVRVWFKMLAPPVQMLRAASKPRTCRPATAEAALLPSRSCRAKPPVDRAASLPPVGRGRAQRRRSPRSSGWHKPHASHVSPGARFRRKRPVTVGEREAIGLAPAPVPERGNGDCETSWPSAHDGERPASNFAGLKAPRQLCHLNIAAVAPYDNAAFVERCVGIENHCTHRRSKLTRTRSRCNAIKRRTDVQRLSFDGGRRRMACCRVQSAAALRNWLLRCCATRFGENHG